MSKNINNYCSVKNINETSNPRYIITNLGDKYIRAGGIKSNICQVINCSNHGNKIAHVIKTYSKKNNDYFLTKLCSIHNSFNNDIELKVNTLSLISINIIKNLK